MNGAVLDAATVRRAAQGRWQSILPSLSIDVPNNPRKHAPCPTCGGKDRFRFDDRDGNGGWYCNQCDPHAGDGFALVMKAQRLPFREALSIVAGILGLDPTSQTRIQRPLPSPPVRVDRRALAFRYELAALDLRLRAERTIEAGKSVQVDALNDCQLDRAMNAVARAHDDMERAEIFEQVADGLMAKHHTNARGAR